MQPIDNERQLGILVGDIYRAWREAIDSIAKSYNMTRTEWHIIGKLYCRGPKLSQCELRETLQISTAQLSRALNQLADRDIIIRAIDKTNRRANFIELKNKKAKYIKDIDLINNEINEMFLAELTTDEQKKLIDLLIKVKPATQRIKDRITKKHIK